MAGEAHACMKEGELGELHGVLSFFQEAEIRREGRELRMLDTLEKFAAQGAQQGESIRVLQESVGVLEKDMEQAFVCIRKLQQLPWVVRLAKSQFGRYVLAFFFAGAIIGYVKHPDTLIKVIQAILN